MAVDVGASKTLLAVFDSAGKISAQQKFSTQKDYANFLAELESNYAQLAAGQIIKSIAVAVPGAVNVNSERIVTNLNWGDITLKLHLQTKHKLPVTIANDANLGALSEARIGAGQGYQTVLYVTISTGVGTGIVVDGQIVLPRSEGGQIIQQYSDSGFMRFEDLVGGPDFIERFGKPGFEVKDPAIWEAFAKDLAVGLFNLITVIGPDVVILGGGMARHYPLFDAPLKQQLAVLNKKLWYPTPPVLQAKNVETAVIQGCYLLAKDSVQ